MADRVGRHRALRHALLPAEHEGKVGGEPDRSRDEATRDRIKRVRLAARGLLEVREDRRREAREEQGTRENASGEAFRQMAKNPQTST